MKRKSFEVGQCADPSKGKLTLVVRSVQSWELCADEREEKASMVPEGLREKASGVRRFNQGYSLGRSSITDRF